MFKEIGIHCKDYRGDDSCALTVSMVDDRLCLEHPQIDGGYLYFNKQELDKAVELLMEASSK